MVERTEHVLIHCLLVYSFDPIMHILALSLRCVMHEEEGSREHAEKPRQTDERMLPLRLLRHTDG